VHSLGAIGLSNREIRNRVLHIYKCAGRFRSRQRQLSSFPLNLFGKPHLPEGNGPFPVVVRVHPTTQGSDSNARWRSNPRNALLNKEVGIFFSDSYTGRGLPRRNTARYLNISSRYIDGVRMLVALASHPKINADRIGISGASFGAEISMRLQWKNYMDQVQPDGFRYAAHVPIYPPCNAIIVITNP